MTEAAGFLFAVTWKACVLVLLGMAVSQFMRSRSADLRHQVWLIVIVGLVMSPCLALSIPHWRAPNFDAAWRWLEKTPVALPGAAPVARGSDLDGVEQLGVFQADFPADAAGLRAIAVSVVVAWLLGAVVTATRSISSYRAAYRLVRRARPVKWQHLSPAAVRILESEEIAAPGAVGIFRPVVLFPPAAATWPPLRRASALAHELAHIKRRDSLVQLVVAVVRVLHWHNPLVHHAVRRIEAEREFACDDVVVASGFDAAGYADALLASARDGGTSPRRGVLAMAGRPELAARCSALFEERPRAALSRRCAAATGVLAAPLLALLAAADVGHAQPMPPTPEAAPPLAGGDPAGQRWTAHGLNDPRSELLPRDYGALLSRARSVPATGVEANAIAALKAELDRRPRGEQDFVRERAIWCLTQIREGDLGASLIAKLADPDWRVTAYAAWGLGVAREERAVAPLTELLRSGNWRIRAMATAALAAIGPRPASRQAMAAALHDPAWQVRVGVVDYFAQSPDADAENLVRAARLDPHEVVSGAARRAAESPRRRPDLP